MWTKLRWFLFLLEPELAHFFACKWIQLLGFLKRNKKVAVHPKLEGKFYLAEFPLVSPIGIAAGFDKNAQMVHGLTSMGFGFLELGTVTPRPQRGNPGPRIFRLPEAESLINRLGFNNQGMESMAHRLERIRALYSLPIPLGINIGKNRDTSLDDAEKDYVLLIQRLYSLGDYFVVNISSPNTPGLRSLFEKDRLSALLLRIRTEAEVQMRKVGAKKRPLFLKLSPDLSWDSMQLVFDVAMDVGLDGFVIANTSIRRDFALLKGCDPKILAEEGGLSGRALVEENIALIKKARAYLGARPIIIGVGGLSTENDVLSCLDAGANLVQLYTAFIYQGPGLVKRMNRKLANS
ncbi:MAG: quinone-dependent dihydroorotate dehydrogenase [Oligoflexia bacterium]|nr:quinone-dependent dihydroorotate dehydrogenase [Oligoflexia bacterium]